MATTKAVDFSKVKDGGGAFNRNRIPSGDYAATIIKVEDAVSKKDDTFQFLFTIQIDKYPTRKIPYYCKLQENQLWKLRNLLIAAGLSVPKARVKVDPNRAVGKKIGVTVEDEEFDGKEQSGIAAVFPAADLVDGDIVEDEDFVDEDTDDDGDEDLTDLGAGDDAEDEEEETVEDDEDEPADEGDAYDELDRTGLKAELKKRDAAFVARKSQTDDDLRTLLREGDAKKAAAAAKAKAKPATKTKAKAAVEDISDEDMEELDLDDI